MQTPSPSGIAEHSLGEEGQGEGVFIEQELSPTQPMDLDLPFHISRMLRYCSAYLK